LGGVASNDGVHEDPHVSRSEYENPVEQVMYILGFKQAPQFETVMHAIAYGANPGILDAVDQMATYGAIDANFHALAKAVETVKASVFRCRSE
jgi:hypothetical protein